MRVGFYFILAGLIIAGMFVLPILCADVAAFDAENQAELYVEALDQDCVDLMDSGVAESHAGTVTQTGSADIVSDYQTNLFLAQLAILQAEIVPSLDIMIRD